MTSQNSKIKHPRSANLEVSKPAKSDRPREPAVTADHSARESGKKNGWRTRFALRTGKRAFWIWIAYQSVKGTLTLFLIWIPIFLLWFSG